MNQNIEVINENLWAINFYYHPYILELEYTGDQENLDLKVASYTNDGKIILNKHNEIYPTLKKFVPALMKNTDDDLEKKLFGMKNKIRDSYEELYMFCLELEINRRSVAKEYVKGSKKPLSIFKTIERTVKKWLQ